ncbi:LLM class flavin-dependent oxidoreductase [Rhizobium leguminosarum bv. viciae]|uniref:LLM class flavin-dependent oxidoreductase n=1 Tax=Rhizobium leguminosarum TaxID=384 RepID=UPI0010390EE3|nr:LLM class flavin-dependent oxidoreductase [Rhizobium leguminosarum]MBY5485332.1 LLM class flavin-dependent oxidoreductase [Rhizobium leguminosarum]TBY80659.1 LLM class flavin-dependent oxidoreductase [Rhizobium leguminosarum bv. viciae]TBZ31117.1 LLM class flavin-dependent oxidoreductase [Rhizobium leguminosarum bv. viciae]TBZ52174.1 LLM class flavin-dependent oxidoreductase [Rhizobium leguminosarum bv. viciae]TBZ80529.1 LLM class flavin-dependent oxidoreductase [Rhizobium leguminosarum bv.
MEIGIDSFAMLLPDPDTGRLQSAVDRMESVLSEVELADQVGLDVFGMGEHHRENALDSAPAVILAAAAARTKSIRLTSAVAVLSASDPVRLFQEFATLDLISRGRAELVVGRGSSVEAYPLFGFDLRDYDALFAEKLDLLLKIREQPNIKWQGRFRPAINGEGVFPRPHQPKLPIWLGVGGTPESFVRAGTLGLPLMVAIIGGSFERFLPLVELYRRAWLVAGHPAENHRIGVHALGFVGKTDEAAKKAFFPGWFQMFTDAGRERGWPPPTQAQFEHMCGPGGAFLVGSPQTVAAKISHVNRTLGGIARITFQMSTAALDAEAMRRSIELLGTDVAPLVRGQLRD